VVGPRFTPELGEYKLAEQLAADVLLLGRRTYESFYGAWPQRDGEMAEKINTMKKVVASTTMTSSPWANTTIIADVPSAVAELKEADGGPILVAGSRTLVHALLDAGLVDELNLQVFPLILGSGMRLYPDADDLRELELVSSQALPNGVLTQTYRVGG
jgi:dihydrofolate reductase